MNIVLSSRVRCRSQKERKGVELRPFLCRGQRDLPAGKAASPQEATEGLVGSESMRASSLAWCRHILLEKVLHYTAATAAEIGPCLLDILK